MSLDILVGQAKDGTVLDSDWQIDQILEIHRVVEAKTRRGRRRCGKG